LETLWRVAVLVLLVAILVGVVATLIQVRDVWEFMAPLRQL
jgi:hypothetical protein